MISEFSVELLAAWMAIEDYKHTTSRQERLDKLTTIRQRFLLTGAQDELNLTSDQREEMLNIIEAALSGRDLENNAEQGDRDILDRLQSQVENAIAVDTLPRFKRTEKM